MATETPNSTSGSRDQHLTFHVDVRSGLDMFICILLQYRHKAVELSPLLLIYQKSDPAIHHALARVLHLYLTE